ncbi:MAG: hypothetical protein CSA33_03700 [Desulfobulbus propionicus]|nr:MAG: hypothetical protein CSA33_03700 [Desulfobulbus propionicus]
MYIFDNILVCCDDKQCFTPRRQDVRKRPERSADFLVRIFHEQCVLSEKKETKTDEWTVGERVLISIKCASTRSPEGTIFGSLLATHMPQ